MGKNKRRKNRGGAAARPGRQSMVMRQVAKKIKRYPAAAKEAKAFLADLELYKAQAHKFWMIHGANMLASDYETGTWNPLVDIYDGGSRLPSAEAVLDLAIARYYDQALASWTDDRGIQVASWILSGQQHPDGLFMFYRRALENLAAEDLPRGSRETPEERIRAPHQYTVWKMFAGLLEKGGGAFLDGLQDEEGSGDGTESDGVDDRRGDGEGEGVQRQDGGGENLDAQPPAPPLV